MEESIIIKQFLSYEYPDSHQLIYLYASGKLKHNSLAVNKVIFLTNKIFQQSNDVILKNIIIEFLNNKKELYLKGDIKIKRIYC